MNLADIPNTPREAYESLTGKRPELLLTATQGHLLLNSTDAAPNTRHYFAFYLNANAELHFVFVGGNN